MKDQAERRWRSIAKQYLFLMNNSQTLAHTHRRIGCPRLYSTTAVLSSTDSIRMRRELAMLCYQVS